MKTIYISFFILLFSIVSKTAKAQKIDSLALHQVDFLEHRLSTSKTIALKVDSIFFIYKKKVYQLLAEQNKRRDEKEILFNKLVVEKYLALKILLSDEQITKILPTTELKTITDKN